MTRWLAILVTAVSMLAGVPACAQEDPQNASSYLPLYPPGDVYQIQVIGDGISEGLLAGLNEAFRGDQRIQFKPKAAELSTLIAHRPMARTDLRTKSTSTSVAYSFSSDSTWVGWGESVRSTRYYSAVKELFKT